MCEAATGNFLCNLRTLAQAIERPAHYPQINLYTGTDRPELQMLYSKTEHPALQPPYVKVPGSEPMAWLDETTMINFAQVEEEWDVDALPDGNSNHYAPNVVAGMLRDVLPEGDHKGSCRSQTTSTARGSKAKAGEKEPTQPETLPGTTSRRSPLVLMLAFLVARAEAASYHVLTPSQANAWSDQHRCIMLSIHPMADIVPDLSRSTVETCHSHGRIRTETSFVRVSPFADTVHEIFPAQHLQLPCAITDSTWGQYSALQDPML